jgi:hypothetical protein
VSDNAGIQEMSTLSRKLSKQLVALDKTLSNVKNDADSYANSMMSSSSSSSGVNVSKRDEPKNCKKKTTCLVFSVVFRLLSDSKFGYAEVKDRNQFSNFGANYGPEKMRFLKTLKKVARKGPK